MIICYPKLNFFFQSSFDEEHRHYISDVYAQALENSSQMDQSSSSSWETMNSDEDEVPNQQSNMDDPNPSQSSSSSLWETMNSDEDEAPNQETNMNVTEQDSFSDESNCSSTGYVADNEVTNETMRHYEVSKRLSDFYINYSIFEGLRAQVSQLKM